MDRNDIIAMRCGCGMENDGQYWSDDQKELLMHCFSKGYGISELAVLLQRSEPAVMQQIAKEGLFEREIKQRQKRTPCACYCEKCPKKEFCPFSPANREETLCMMEGAVAGHV